MPAMRTRRNDRKRRRNVCQRQQGLACDHHIVVEVSDTPAPRFLSHAACWVGCAVVLEPSKSRPVHDASAIPNGSSVVDFISESATIEFTS